MFGIFKKKAPALSVELSDDELDLIHGGYTAGEMESPTASPSDLGPTFHMGDAAAAFVGGGRRQERSSR
jgi:hypothetical protein